MSSRRKFLQQSGLGLLSLLASRLPVSGERRPSFGGLVVSEDEGEAFRLRDGSAIVRIKIAKTQGPVAISFLSESFSTGDEVPVHKHANEDELIFLHRGSGLLTFGEKEIQVHEGAVALVPKGIWHGLKNTGSGDLEMRFGYTPSGFEGFFREVGTPINQPFVAKTK